MAGSAENGQATVVEAPQGSETEYLRLLGDAIRSARAHEGLTRRALAQKSGVSERFLAQLESGSGNASVLVLRQIAAALGVSPAALLSGPAEHADLLHTFDFLRKLSPGDVQRARDLLIAQLGHSNGADRRQRIALIGLRGAGKSTVGARLAKKLEFPFLELDRLIEQASGVSLGMIFELYGQSGFRDFESRCLDDLLAREPRFVLATGGSIVSEASTYQRLRASCFTMWLRAEPEEHMQRVVAQGDMRPMANNPESMSQLRQILAEREPLYKQADATVLTSGRGIEQVVNECVAVAQAEKVLSAR
jgi:XRE family aerobic/anaerobic benzoate catabolism transcriptional regulator